MMDDLYDDPIDATSQNMARRMFGSDSDHEMINAMHLLRRRLRRKNIPLHDLTVTFNGRARDRATLLDVAHERIEDLKQKIDYLRRHVSIDVIRACERQADYSDDFRTLYGFIEMYFGGSRLPSRWRSEIAAILGVETGDIEDWETGDPVPDEIIKEMELAAKEHSPSHFDRLELIEKIIQGRLDHQQLKRLMRENAAAVSLTGKETEAVRVLLNQGFTDDEIATMLALPVVTIHRVQGSGASRPKKIKSTRRVAPKPRTSLPPSGVRRHGEPMDAEEFYRIIAIFESPDKLRRYSNVSSGSYGFWRREDKNPRQEWAEVFRHIYRRVVSGEELSEEWVDQIKIKEGLEIKQRRQDARFKPFRLSLSLPPPMRQAR